MLRDEFGRDGASPGALAELDAVLESFELVKLRTGAGKKKAARALAENEVDRMRGWSTLSG